MSIIWMTEIPYEDVQHSGKPRRAGKLQAMENGLIHKFTQEGKVGEGKVTATQQHSKITSQSQIVENEKECI